LKFDISETYANKSLSQKKIVVLDFHKTLDDVLVCLKTDKQKYKKKIFKKLHTKEEYL
jgi:hypothetical protein